jgi:hypothetical protein
MSTKGDCGAYRPMRHLYLGDESRTGGFPRSLVSLPTSPGSSRSWIAIVGLAPILTLLEFLYHGHFIIGETSIPDLDVNEFRLYLSYTITKICALSSARYTSAILNTTRNLIVIVRL